MLAATVAQRTERAFSKRESAGSIPAGCIGRGAVGIAEKLREWFWISSIGRGVPAPAEPGSAPGATFGGGHMVERKVPASSDEPDDLTRFGRCLGCLLVLAFVLGAGVWSMFVQVVK